MYGYVGKILRLDLSDRQTSIIETQEYVEWGGGHGIGSAIFFDLCKDKRINGFDPSNVVTIMTSPLAGSIAPGASGRTEVQGIGVDAYPIGWFTRSNFGGRFGSMLKYAGWDGIVIEGKSDRPVWVDIRNNKVEIKEGRSLWGLDAWETQQQIWREIVGGKLGDWWQVGESKHGPRTTQRPAVLAIGPAGENLCRSAVLLHDAGNAAAQGGFGGVWGSKNLKAISVIGTGNVQVANPEALLSARLSKEYTKKIKDPRFIEFWPKQKESRPQGCVGCHEACRGRFERYGNESQCVESVLSNMFTQKNGVKSPDAVYMGADLTQRYGINAYQIVRGIPYLKVLNDMGVLGKGKSVACDLPFDKITDVQFLETLLRKVAYKEGIGVDLAEGFPRAAERWGRVSEDLRTGILPFPYWGYPEHHYDPRCELEWGYGSILSERDINEHCFNIPLYWLPRLAYAAGKEPPISAEDLVNACAAKLYPYEGNPNMLDFSTENMYSEDIVKLVSWQRDYTRFWKQSIMYCDFRFPAFLTPMAMVAETLFYSAVTGKEMEFVEGLEIGRRIWNLDNAIWSLQGRHRDMVHFADYIYSIPYPDEKPYIMPGIENGEWKYIKLNGRHLDRAKFEEFKTKFYELQGWDVTTGWVKRATLENQGLNYVADELAKNGRLGEP